MTTGATHSKLQTLKRLLEQPVAKHLRTAMRIAIVFAVLGLLTKRIGDIGWPEIARNLPGSAAFFVIFALHYFVQPIGEYIIYRYLWSLKRRSDFTIFMRKRVFNAAVVAYSGEAMLYLWAQAKPELKPYRKLSNIKDNLILSALVSNGLTVIMVLFFMMTGQMERFFHVAPDVQLYIVVAAIIAILLTVTVIRFRSTILEISAKQTRTIFGVHSIRILIAFALQVAMWATALPMVPLETWLVLVTLQLVLTRIPFLPNQDLIFLGLVLSISSFLEASDQAVAGAFLMIGALTQVSHLFSFLATTFAGARLDTFRALSAQQPTR